MKENSQVLVVRAKPDMENKEDQFLGGIASIGWRTGVSLKGKSKEEIGKIIRSLDENVSKVWITQIDLFVHLPKGSIILTPSYKTRDIHIFKTISEYEYIAEWNDEKYGNPHTIKIKHLKTIPRSILPEAIQRSLNAAKKTVTNFSKYSDEINLIAKTENLDKEKTFDIRQTAVETIVELLKSDNDEIRFKAALTVLDTCKEAFV
ncbi:hypothetical protein K8T06_01040 [bacterium]|nr:hypothetical protein [bacterium]